MHVLHVSAINSVDFKGSEAYRDQVIRPLQTLVFLQDDAIAETVRLVGNRPHGHIILMSLSCYQHWIEPQIESPFARVKSSYLPNSEDPGRSLCRLMTPKVGTKMNSEAFWIAKTEWTSES